jgi:dUTP pyrophosphatase
MITKSLFISTIERLKEFEKRVDDFEKGLNGLMRGFETDICFPEPSDIILKLLEEIFNDNELWISYFIYECDYLESFKIGDVEHNGKLLDLSTWDRVYDFLLRNMQEDRGNTECENPKDNAEAFVTTSEILIATTDGNVIVPSKRDGDGCFDIYAYFAEESVRIEPFSTKLVPTGIHSAFDNKFRISIRERGSNTRSNLKVSAGQIDASYRGEWFVPLYNANPIPLEITKYVDEVKRYDDIILVPYKKAIAQFAVEQVPEVCITTVSMEDVLGVNSERGDGALGSSGK